MFERLWSNYEVIIGMLSGSVWAILNVALGGIDAPIKGLAILMIADFITGVSAGFRNKELSSSVGSKGLFKKVGILVCIIIAYVLDLATGMNVFRGMVISGFAVIEAMSLIENIDRIGCGYIIPEFLRSKLQQIAVTKYGKKVDKND